VVAKYRENFLFIDNDQWQRLPVAAERFGMGSLAGGDNHEDVFEHVVRRKRCQGGEEDVTAPRIVNVTATVCFQWKNSANCAHLTFRVLGSPVPKSAYFEPIFPRFLRLWRDFDHLWVSAATRFARDGCLWAVKAKGQLALWRWNLVICLHRTSPIMVCALSTPKPLK